MSDSIIENLINKKRELEERLGKLYQGGSQRRENLEYKINKIENLISAYQKNSPPLDLKEAELILNQQTGFSEQKKKILNNLKIQKNPSIIFLIGPPGVGKTSFAQLLAQALKKEFFSISLGGLSDSSVLVGASESSSGIEVGLLTKSLLETKTNNPLILLDEIDKVFSYKGSSAIHACLSNFLDPLHSKGILDHYLDVKLDFSQVTFIITANDSKKIPNYFLSRTSLIVELSGYNLEQKKEIANLFIKQWFEQNQSLNPDNLEITSEALTILINKTKEKGVRQLKSALENVFDYCLLRWNEETKEGKIESKIKINSELVQEIIPCDFFNIDSEDDKNSILEYSNYSNFSQNRESEKSGEKETLSKLKPKKTTPNPSKSEKEKSDYQIEIERLKEQFQSLQKESRNKDKIMFFSVIGFLIIWGIYGIIKLLKLFKNNKQKKRLFK